MDNFSLQSRVVPQQSLWLTAKAVEGMGGRGGRGGGGAWEGNQALKGKGEKGREGGGKGRESESNFGTH